MENRHRPLRGALIGCGFVSKHHIEGWLRIAEAELVAICDRDEGRLAGAGNRAPGARRYRDAAELFQAEPGLDFMEVCTLADTHLELVRLAAEHGVHVLCQKPAANGRAELLAMISTCESAGVRLMIHENWRFRPWYRELKRQIEQGRIGRPIRLRIEHRDTRALVADGYNHQPYLGQMTRLILMDMGCHVVDVARYLFGEVKSVSATLGRFGLHSRGEDLAVLTLEFTSGAIGTLDLNWCAAPDLRRARPEWALNATEVEGDLGGLQLSPGGTLQWRGIKGEAAELSTSMPDADRVYGQGYEATQRHFVDGLLTGAEHETRGTDNLKTMEVVWAAYESAERGCKILL